MTEVYMNAGMAQHFCTDDEYRAILADLPPDKAFYDVCGELSNDAITPTQRLFCLRQLNAFWHAHGDMAQTFKTQAEDWRKVVETLRQELDGKDLQE